MTSKNFRMFLDSDPKVDMQPSNFTPAAAFTSDNHRELNHYFHQAADDSILAGVWESAPCREEFESYLAHEMMTIISGALVLTNADGVEESFGPGEVVFVAKGSKMTWHITERLKKYYMTSA